MDKLKSVILLLLISFYSSNLFADDSSAAIQNAAQENKHLFIFFYKEQNDKTQAFQSIFNRALQKMGDQVKSLKVKATDPSAKPLIDRFNLKRTPMPFVLVLAPNGAITGGFPSFTEEQLKDSLTSPGAASCLKALQDRKLVLLCLQNSRTAHNEAAMKGVNEFKADPIFGEATVIVKIDPSNAEEAKFLHQLAVDTNSSQAVTILISPPAQVVGTYRGPTTKATLVSDLQKANSGCCPGGCCPGGKCG